MPTIVLVSTILIFSALFSYSIGVWAERFAHTLKPWHLVFFLLGLVFDTAGTAIMYTQATVIEFSLHAVTGVAAILLMLVHAVWAAVVLKQNDARQLQNFHKFSIGVWLLWLIPFISGLVMGSQH